MRRTVALCIILAACTDSAGPTARPAAEAPQSPFTVSNAHSVAAVGSLAGGAVTTAHVVYVSLSEGSIPNADLVTIHARAAGTTVSAKAQDGGLDPVAVAANVGDTLDIKVQLSDGGSPVQFTMGVPIHAPPVVIRTVPPPHKRDVPLNARMLVVFSEPLSSSSLNGTISVVSGNAGFSGTLAFADSEHVSIVFTPLLPLAPSLAYTLKVDTTVTDVDGERLPAPVLIDFTTAPAGPVDVIGTWELRSFDRTPLPTVVGHDPNTGRAEYVLRGTLSIRADGSFRKVIYEGFIGQAKPDSGVWEDKYTFSAGSSPVLSLTMGGDNFGTGLFSGGLLTVTYTDWLDFWEEVWAHLP